MKPRITLILVLLLGAAGLYGTWISLRAHRNLVTLNVRNMDVRQVVKKIEWQTWERILVHQDVEGKVTLNVRRAPLEDVLGILGEQTSSRWSALYPLYSSGKSLAALKKSLRGEINPVTHGWTNLPNRGFFRGGPGFGGGPFGTPDPATNQLVSLNLIGNDISFAVLAYGRYARVRVVPEDGTIMAGNLALVQVTVPEAVARLARKVQRDWTKLYTLRTAFRPGGSRQFASRDPNRVGHGAGPEPRHGDASPPRPPDDANLAPADTNAARRQPDDPRGMTVQPLEGMRHQRAALEAELRQALPPAEQECLEQVQQQRHQRFREMQCMTPEQRRERFAQMSSGAMDQHNRDRVRNTTPEQRIEQQRRMLQMRRHMQQLGRMPSPPPRSP